MLQKKEQGMSLFEVMVAFFLFSLTLLVLSPRIESLLYSIDQAETSLQEAYYRGM